MFDFSSIFRVRILKVIKAIETGDVESFAQLSKLLAVFFYIKFSIDLLIYLQISSADIK